ncbi:TolC family protein [Variovorax sp. OV329]|uniref:TolC family protein n=1 Tax=Variovorax sp. OV329 TaxID=1882825 RepID=UPI0008E05986|nr:TolC family protein [Variovorax sp. OV329]SFN01955.1 outer membrane protein, cobalt-zinc-cadmium efflux system [Variovorax sp. OV329]
MRSLYAPVALAIVALAASTCVLAQSSFPTAGPAMPAPVGATTSQPLTLPLALQRALEANPELSGARNQLGAAEGARVQAGAWLNPTVEALLEDTRPETRTTTIALSQPIELGGKRDARMAAADRAIDIARAQLTARQYELQASVTAAFFAALIAQDRVSLARASLDLARRGSDAAGKRVTAGKVSPVEETKAKVAEAEVRVQLLQAEGELKTALQQLRAAIGSGAAIAAVDGNALDVPAMPSAEQANGLLDSAPALLEARLEIQRQQALVELERAKRISDVTFTLGAKRDAELARNQAVVGVSIPLPVFDANRGNIQEAYKRRDKAEDLARATEVRLLAEVAGARQRFETSVEEVAALKREILPGAQSAFDAATKGYELGKFSYLDALDAQRTLLQARAQYLRALAETHRSASDLNRLIGTPGIDAAALPKARP